MLRRYLQDRPRSAAVQSLVPENEIEERLALGRKMDSAIRGTEFDDDESHERKSSQWTAFRLSVIMIMPLEKLRQLPFTSEGQFDEMKRLVKIFLQRSLAGSQINRPQSDKHSNKSASTPKSQKRKLNPDADYPAEKGSVNRNTTEARKCLKRDKLACIFLGTANPEACPIVPFAVNSTQANSDKIDTLRGVYRLFWPDGNSAFHRLVAGQLGSSDSAWNMLSMNRQMRLWWAKAFFAIKCLGVTPGGDGGDSTIQMQFHWMQRRILQDPDRKIDIVKGRRREEAHTDKGKGKAAEVSSAKHDKDVDECEARKFVRGPETYYGDPSIWVDGSGSKDRGIVSAADAGSGRLLHSGRIFEIQMPAQDAENMRIMLDFQWACILISVMSGAAGWPDFFDEDDDDEDDDDLVGEWLETTSFTSPPDLPADTPEDHHMSSEEGTPGIFAASSPCSLVEIPPQPRTEPPEPRDVAR